MTQPRKFLCPSCKIPILVGEHSVTIDKERIKGIAMQELVDAARDIQANIHVNHRLSPAIRAVELPKLERLTAALEAIERASE